MPIQSLELGFRVERTLSAGFHPLEGGSRSFGPGVCRPTIMLFPPVK